MSRHTGAPSKAQGRGRPMRARSQHEEHRSRWALHERPRATSLLEASLAPLTVLLILPTPFSGQAVLLTGLLLSALLTIKLVGRHRVGAVKEIA